MNTSDTISRKVLFVDDELLLLEGIKRQLRREIDLTIAEGGANGLAILAEEGPFAVVVSDYNMPGMNGIDFLNAVYQRYPQSVLVMLTGRAEQDLVVNALHKGHISRFLNKPCSKEVLIETLNDGLEQYRLRMSEQLLQAQLQLANEQLNSLNGQLVTLVAQKTRALELQYHYAADMALMTTSQEVIAALTSTVSELTGIQEMALWLSPQLGHQFTCFHPADNQFPLFNTETFPNGLVADTFRRNSFWLHGKSSQPVSDFDRTLFLGKPLMCLPLHGKQGVFVGMLNLSGDSIQLGNETIEALQGMANVTATALQSLWHREAFDDAQDAIITSLAKLAEYRDPETGAHLLRLKKYSTLLCGFLAETTKYKHIVTPEFTRDLVRSSPLHDIGKVGIPDAILKKPGKLTAEEFEIMKTHAEIGGDTLRAVYEQYPTQSFIKCGMDIAYAHHEKWNGSGYPKGLQGDDIPLAAQILALVDVYDALTCRRIYKAPFPRQQANNIIIEGSGKHFCPDIVEAFLVNEAEFYDIAEQYADFE